MPKGILLPAPVTLSKAIEYSEMDGLMCLNITDVEGLSIKDFLLKFFTKWNKYGSLNTYLLKNMPPEGAPSVSPYIYCSGSRRRSIGDMYSICKYYYPETTFMQVRTIIHDLVKEQLLKTWICGTINKRVFWNPNVGGGTIEQSNTRDEYGWKYDEVIVDDLSKTEELKTT